MIEEKVKDPARVVSTPPSVVWLMTLWPERTEPSTVIDVTTCGSGSAGGAGISTPSDGRPCSSSGGSPASAVSAPSMPRIAMPRAMRSATSACSAPGSGFSTERSRITARPLNRVGERLRLRSRPASHSASGGSGASASALNARPRRLSGRAAGAAAAAGAADSGMVGSGRGSLMGARQEILTGSLTADMVTERLKFWIRSANSAGILGWGVERGHLKTGVRADTFRARGR